MPNAPPTVATAAAASPNPATGTTTSLGALGADDAGEADLTWPGLGITLNAAALSAHGATSWTRVT